ncbi:MAG: trypsin-like peptidase domain-containing protein [Christensenellaceae bacterium]|nr:trypsin-like peptidase domain-containing protein [Christensenellaceae bacterium]
MNDFNESNFVNGSVQGVAPNGNGQSGDKVRSVSWSEGDKVHVETTVIHKNVPSVGTILITAITFLVIGALVASGILLARFIEIDTISAALVGSLESDDPSNTTNPPLITNPSLATNPPAGDATGGGSHSPSIVFGDANPIPNIYSSSVEGVVIINSYSGNRNSNYNLIGTGTGFFISTDGYVLTNAHVVEDAVSVWITFYDGSNTKASIVGYDVSTDVAVLRVEASKVTKALTIGNSDSVQTGDFVLAIGHPTGEELSFTGTFGMVGAVNRSVLIDGMRNTYIQIDAAINPGNSGGPLFDMNGNVIGINSAKTVIASYNEDGEPISAEGLGFALPINNAMDIASKLIEDGSIPRPGIGVSVITINEQRAESFNIPCGALVYSVIKDGPAHKAGLYADDIIVKAGDTEITDKELFVEIIQGLNVGDSIELQYWRDGEMHTCTLVVGNLNEIGSEVLDDAYGGSNFGF